MLGASLPIAPFEDAVGGPVLILPIANYDNNQHAANENLRVGNLWDAIEVFAALFTRLPAQQ
jgi:acetylornithine deacetylase/succinyl-diaminopimelate desuccinylase-like protein